MMLRSHYPRHPLAPYNQASQELWTLHSYFSFYSSSTKQKTVFKPPMWGKLKDLTLHESKWEMGNKLKWEGLRNLLGKGAFSQFTETSISRDGAAAL